MNIPPYALRRHELPVTSASVCKLFGSTEFHIFPNGILRPLQVSTLQMNMTMTIQPTTLIAKNPFRICRPEQESACRPIQQYLK
jgi:hypothetical protein